MSNATVLSDILKKHRAKSDAMENIMPKHEPTQEQMRGLYDEVHRLLQSDCAPETWAVIKRFTRFFPASNMRAESERPNL